MERKLPPVWLLGLMGNLPIGVFGAIMLMTLPQLLAARGVPEPQIAAVTAAALIPGFGAFLLSPILDWRFRRRSYGVALLILTAVLQFAALMSLGNIALLTALLVAASLTVTLQIAAVGGWLGSFMPPQAKAQLGAWYAVASIAGFGIVSILAITLLRELPYGIAAAILSLVLLLPLAVFPFLPSKPADGRLAHESFRAFFRDLAVLLGRREILWTLLFFVLPAADFALTNMMGGLGAAFGTSERMVGLLAGIGVTIAGVVGSLAVPPVLRRAVPLWLYLAIGGTGAVFTLSLMALPHTPFVFALALLGENVFQAAAFAVEYAIILRTIGEDNPFAATQFALLNSATTLPLAYMQALDGQAYGAGGFASSLLTDGGLALAACVTLAILQLWRQRAAKPLPA